jgi:RNA polymerase sigma-70 factor (ECF subfamily)
MSQSPDESEPLTPAEGEAFVQLFGKAQHSLRAFVLSLVKNWDDAEDILQDTNLILWRKFRSFDRGTDFRKWACQVAHFEVLEWRRRKFKDKQQVGLSENVLSRLASDLIADADATDQRGRALDQCLSKLSAADRELIQLRYFSGNSIQAVGDAVRRSSDAVYKAINRIRWRLLECVQRQLRQEERS